MNVDKLAVIQSLCCLSLCTVAVMQRLLDLYYFLLWLSWDSATSVWTSACVNKCFSNMWCQTESSCLGFGDECVSLSCISHPQSPKPISQSSDDCGSFSSFLICSEGKKYSGNAPVGGWDLEFWSSLSVPPNFPKLFNVCLYFYLVCMPVPINVCVVFKWKESRK